MSIPSALIKAGKPIAKEAVDQVFKSLPDFMGKLGKVGAEVGASPQTMDSIGKHLASKTAKDLPKEMADVDTIFKALGSNDVAIREAGYRSLNDLDSNIRPLQEKQAQADAMVKRADSFKAKALYGEMNRQGKAGKESGEEIASKFTSPEERKAFNKKYGDISRRQPGAEYTSPFAPHHLVPHEDAARINNRNDAAKIWQEVNKISAKKRTPGNAPENLIAAMHRKNAAWIQSGKDSIIKQKPEWKHIKQPYTWNDPYLGELTSTPDRILKDISKDAGNAPYAAVKDLSSIGLPKSGKWPNGNKVTANQKTAAWQNRFKYHGIERKNVKFDPKGDIIGSDHVEIGHRAIEAHPKYKAMQDLLADQERYLKMTPKEVAPIIEDGLAIADNVFININKLRLDLIKEKLGFLIRTGVDKNGRPKFKQNKTILAQYEGQVTERIMTWIKDNPAASAALGWKSLTGNIEDMLKWLEVDPGKTTDEFNEVFSYEVAQEGLKEISPGVAVGANYKPGKDKALDSVLAKLAEDPSSLDSSGFGGSVGGDLQRIVND